MEVGKASEGSCRDKSREACEPQESEGLESSHEGYVWVPTEPTKGPILIPGI